MKVIVGLGNPGKEYEETYHNMGYMFLDDFAKKHSIIFSKNKYHSMFGEGLVNGEKVILLKPTIYYRLTSKAG